MMTNEKRQPKGVPVGGQFATGARIEGEDLLADPPAPYGSYYSDVRDLTEVLWSNTVNLHEGGSRQIAAEILADPNNRRGPGWADEATAKAYRIAVEKDTAIEEKVAERELAKAKLKYDRVKIFRAVNAFLTTHPDTAFLTVRYDPDSGGLKWTGQMPDGTFVRVLAYSNQAASANRDLIGMDLSDREAWAGFAKDPEGEFGKAVTWNDTNDRLEHAVIDLDQFTIPTVHDERRHY